MWRAPRRIFVNSMSDLFHEGVPDSYIEEVCRVMVAANWHTYQVLTKRSERMRDLLTTRLHFAAEESNIWWGVSVEDRHFGLPRIGHLQTAQAAVSFLSIEPLLEDLGPFDISGIAWVIVGGESGPGARPMDPAWVLSVKQKCREGGIAFFFKQWGGVRKHETGRLLEGQTFDEIPELASAPVKAEHGRQRLIASTTRAASFFAPFVQLGGD